MRTQQQLFDHVVNHLRDQGLDSNRGAILWKVRGKLCACAFGCLLMGRERSTNNYKDPIVVSDWLGYEVNKESSEYKMMQDIEMIYENCYFLASTDSPLDIEIFTNNSKEEKFHDLASKYNLKYTDPILKQYKPLKIEIRPSKLCFEIKLKEESV